MMTITFKGRGTFEQIFFVEFLQKTKHRYHKQICNGLKYILKETSRSPAQATDRQQSHKDEKKGQKGKRKGKTYKE